MKRRLLGRRLVSYTNSASDTCGATAGMSAISKSSDCRAALDALYPESGLKLADLAAMLHTARAWAVSSGLSEVEVADAADFSDAPEAAGAAQQPAKAAPETVAVPAALAALPASRMREELLSQHSLLSELGVALEASEARVRQLERLHGLAQLAEEIRGSAEEAQEAVEGAHE